MSRGIHAKYRLLNTENDIAYYAYGGSNFSFSYDEDIFNSLDGRIQIPLHLFNDRNTIADAIENQIIQVTPCYYAEFNFENFDIFALITINKIISLYQKTKQLPKEGMWVCWYSFHTFS